MFLKKECEICGNTYGLGERVAILRCTHFMHTNCLLTHLAINDNYLCFECEEEIFTQKDVNEFLNKKEESRNLKSEKILIENPNDNDSKININP